MGWTSDFPKITEKIIVVDLTIYKLHVYESQFRYTLLP